jgi:hypothetical protein
MQRKKQDVEQISCRALSNALSTINRASSKVVVVGGEAWSMECGLAFATLRY